MSDSRIGSAAHVAHTAWIGIGAEPQKKLGCLQTNLASGEGDWRSADLVEGIDGHTDLRDQVAHGVDAAISRGAVQDEQRRSTELMQLPFPASEQLARSLVIAILKRSEDLAAHSMCHPRAATASGWKSKRPELSRRFFCLCEHGAPRPPTCPRGPCASGTNGADVRQDLRPEDVVAQAGSSLVLTAEGTVVTVRSRVGWVPPCRFRVNSEC